MSGIFSQFWQACFSVSLLLDGSLADMVYMLEGYTERYRRTSISYLWKLEIPNFIIIDASHWVVWLLWELLVLLNVRSIFN